MTTAQELCDRLALADIESEVVPGHGALIVPVDKDRHLITGYAGWWYGGLEVLVGDMFEPDQATEVPDFCAEADEDDPDKVAAGIVQAVLHLRTTRSA